MSKYAEDLREAIQGVLHTHAESEEETGLVLHFCVAVEMMTPAGEVVLLHTTSPMLSSWHAGGILDAFKDDVMASGVGTSVCHCEVCGGDEDEDHGDEAGTAA